MNNIDIFSNTQFGSLRTFLSTENKIWFCLADVCKILDLQQVSRVKSRLKANGVTIIKGVSQTTNQYGTTSEQEVEMNFIDEPNLYRCVFQSRKKEAEHSKHGFFMRQKLSNGSLKTPTYRHPPRTLNELSLVGNSAKKTQV